MLFRRRNADDSIELLRCPGLPLTLHLLPRPPPMLPLHWLPWSCCCFLLLLCLLIFFFSSSILHMLLSLFLKLPIILFLFLVVLIQVLSKCFPPELLPPKNQHQQQHKQQADEDCHLGILIISPATLWILCLDFSRKQQ
ncbi:hypothetical protein E2320_020639 [Naja naja]|nr:hypothetical protein E2320_020639 [Naja naja]